MGKEGRQDGWRQGGRETGLNTEKNKEVNGDGSNVMNLLSEGGGGGGRARKEERFEGGGTNKGEAKRGKETAWGNEHRKKEKKRMRTELAL